MTTRSVVIKFQNHGGSPDQEFQVMIYTSKAYTSWPRRVLPEASSRGHLRRLFCVPKPVRGSIPFSVDPVSSIVVFVIVRQFATRRDWVVRILLPPLSCDTIGHVPRQCSQGRNGTRHVVGIVSSALQYENSGS